MNTVVNRLLEVDTRARRILDEAQEYREKTLQELEARKVRMREEYAAKARQHLEAVTAEESALVQDEAARLQEAAAALRRDMEARYEKHREAWVEAIVRACIEGDTP